MEGIWPHALQNPLLKQSRSPLSNWAVPRESIKVGIKQILSQWLAFWSARILATSFARKSALAPCTIWIYKTRFILSLFALHQQPFTWSKRKILPIQSLPRPTTSPRDYSIYQDEVVHNPDRDLTCARSNGSRRCTSRRRVECMHSPFLTSQSILSISSFSRFQRLQSLTV